MYKAYFNIFLVFTSITVAVICSGHTAAAQALNFDGVNDYVSASSGTIADGSYFTLEAWVNPGSFLSYNWVVQAGHTTLGASSNGRLTYMIEGSTSNSESNQSIPTNTWSHIALVYNGIYTLYYNGTALGTTPQFNYPGKSPYYLTGFYLSRNGGSEGWIGGIDEVRIWSVARTATEIANNYLSELSNPTSQTGLKAYYKMNEGVAGGTNTGITSLSDASGNNSTATLSGFALTGATSNFIASPFASSCTNPTEGGTIGTASAMAPGSVPAELTQIVAPSGTAVGTLQFKWQSSTTSATVGFSDISGATSSNYQPVALTQTIWYKRLVKVDCESAWLESNMVQITVASSVSWTGATSTDWNTATNWNPAVVPTAEMDATIPTGLTNYPVVGNGTNAAVKNLTHNAAGKQIKVNGSGKLTVNRSCTAVNGAEIKALGQ